ncbi:MAG: hypothetical protein L6R40_006769 [Gallowayella cf. fulva]|nr:MAG: hypothetical protein L6R40_006769 [Xanthomendoza cf. fulva]
MMIYSAVVGSQFLSGPSVSEKAGEECLNEVLPATGNQIFGNPPRHVTATTVEPDPVEATTTDTIETTTNIAGKAKATINKVDTPEKSLGNIKATTTWQNELVPLRFTDALVEVSAPLSLGRVKAKPHPN